MRRLFPLLALLCFAIPAKGQTFVQDVYCHGSTSSFTCPSITNVSSNTGILVIFEQAAAATAPTITDSKTNTYGAPKVNCSLVNAGYTIFYYEADALIAGANTVTIASGTTNVVEGFYLEYSGLAANAFDKTACADSGGSAGPAASGATATTTQANELVVGFASTNRTFTGIGAGSYNQRDSQTFNNAEIVGDQNLIATGPGPSFAPTMNTSGSFGSAVATFKASGGGGASGAGLGGKAGVGGKAGTG